MEIKKIGVIGAGTMGHGIALVCAKNGYDVVMRDIEQKFVDNGMAKINKFLGRSVEKGNLSEEEKNKILNKITPTTKLDAVRDCDVVIEAILEDVNLKKN